MASVKFLLLLAPALVLAKSYPGFAKTNYPDLDVVATPQSAFTKGLDLSKVPALPQRGGAPSVAPAPCTGVNWKTNCDNTCAMSADSACTRDEVTRCSSGKKMGITFDDGPSPDTPRLLDALAATNTKATFCVVGSRVVSNPFILKRMFEEGHQLCVHTWSHYALTSLSNEQIVAELEFTRQAIREITGTAPTYYRPPYGDVDDRVRAVASAMGLKGLLWSYDTYDYLLTRNSTAFDAQGGLTGLLSEQGRLANLGAVSPIILMHDLNPVPVTEAVKALASITKLVPLMSAAECAGDMSPYEDKGIQLPASGAPLSAPILNAPSPSCTTPGCPVVTTTAPTAIRGPDAGTPSGAGRSFSTGIGLPLLLALGAALYLM